MRPSRNLKRKPDTDRSECAQAASPGACTSARRPQGRLALSQKFETFRRGISVAKNAKEPAAFVRPRHPERYRHCSGVRRAYGAISRSPQRLELMRPPLEENLAAHAGRFSATGCQPRVFGANSDANPAFHLTALRASDKKRRKSHPAIAPGPRVPHHSIARSRNARTGIREEKRLHTRRRGRYKRAPHREAPTRSVATERDIQIAHGIELYSNRTRTFPNLHGRVCLTTDRQSQPCEKTRAPDGLHTGVGEAQKVAP